MWHDEDSAKETKQQKEQRGKGLEINWEKGGKQYSGGSS